MADHRPATGGVIYMAQTYITNATGIDAILREDCVPKGSFYQYFKSKEELGLAVIDHFADGFEHRLDTFLKDDEVPPLNRLRNFQEISPADAGLHGGDVYTILCSR